MRQYILDDIHRKIVKAIILQGKKYYTGRILIKFSQKLLYIEITIIYWIMSKYKLAEAITLDRLLDRTNSTRILIMRK